MSLPMDMNEADRIRYLVMFRPPARDMCLDALEEVYRSCTGHPQFFLWRCHR